MAQRVPHQRYPADRDFRSWIGRVGEGRGAVTVRTGFVAVYCHWRWGGWPGERAV